MAKHRKRFGTILVTGIVAGVIVLGLAGWLLWQHTLGRTNDCQEITNHSVRYRCYQKDDDAQLLLRAIRDRDVTLCDGVQHVFRPHDVQNEIDQGIIGYVAEGDEARQICTEAVRRGHRLGG